MAKVKCRWCGKRIDKSESFIPIACNGNVFYCNEEEYNLKMAEQKVQAEEKKRLREEEKQKRAEEREKKKEESIKKQKDIKKNGNKRPNKVDKVYEEVADIFGRRIQNGVLFDEMKLWRQICDDNNILAFMRENRGLLTNVAQREFSNEYTCIRYFSAILKNSLYDFKQKAPVQNVVKIEVNNEMYEPTVSSRKNRRRGLNILEDEV